MTEEAQQFLPISSKKRRKKKIGKQIKKTTNVALCKRRVNSAAPGGRIVQRGVKG